MFKYTYSAAMLLILVVANLIMFLMTGFVHPTEFWICYAFVTFAYITLWGSAFRQENSSMEYLFAITRIRVNSVYVVIAFLLAIALYFFGLDGLLLVIPQAVVAVVFIILMLSLSDIDDRHAEIESEVIRKKDFVKASLDALDRIRGENENEAIDRRISLLIDMLVSAQSSILDEELSSESEFKMLCERLERRLKMDDEEECIEILDKMEKALDRRNFQISQQH